MSATPPTIPMHPAQVQNLLMFIDATQSEPVKESIFTRLGHECFFTRKHDEWIKSFQGDVQTFLDWVNVQQASRFWERLEFNEDHSALILTGRPVDGCACEYSDCAQPPQSLCNYCCKSLQQELFGMLLGQPVEVTITESALLGGERCNTIIELK